MLFPRFSLRASLFVVTACAFFFLVLGQAVRGQAWAIVISVAVISFLVTFLFHGSLYILSSALTRLVGAEQLPARTSQGGVQSSADEQAPVVKSDSLAGKDAE